MNAPANSRRTYADIALMLLFLFLLLFLFYNVLSVFLGVFTFAIILSVALHKVFEWMVSKLGNRRKLTAFIYGLLMLAIVALPFLFIISALNNYVEQAQAWIANAKVNGVPPLPEWARGLPLVGDKIAVFWDDLQKDPATAITIYEPQIRKVTQHLVSSGLGIVGTGLELVLGIIISAVALTSGAKLLDPVNLAIEKIAGEGEGKRLLDASGRAIQGVAIGVMGTALIEALAAWIGFTIAGISFAVGLAALTFFLAVVQLGPLLVVLPVAFWLGAQGETGWAIFMGIYGLVVLMGIDNVLKPILIAKSGKLPILVLFLGVVGGMAAWGFTGMFKGAIIMAVCYTLFGSWTRSSKEKN